MTAAELQTAFRTLALTEEGEAPERRAAARRLIFDAAHFYLLLLKAEESDQPWTTVIP